MRHIIKSSALLVGLVIASAGVSGVYADDENNTLPGEALAITALQLQQPTRGVVFFTAAINTDGSVASCFGCNVAKTKRLAVGRYEIDFGQNIQATNGWSRWLQADTLTIGLEDVWCNTADRAGNTNAVFVNCQHSGGPGSQGESKPIDASFFLFVAR